ncbi:tetratricopeptide repeat protein [Paraburkholderia antibiotica]|uniref:Tetratricopeptide repeat protein n=1 Tax=Paraburkholderia antibiotica TaxID=2728839 RepID=A0A7X9ZY18_9BURK|nr:tetratricopeptide repeat protein [Paraburkholderia antibiotica]NML32451.1 tetratricopeptide repeat protein [Paraburkholderia antibiotica]
MSSEHSQRWPASGHGSPSRRSHLREFLQRGLRAIGFVGRGPKQLWPYVLPWMVGILAIGLFCLVVRDVFTRQLRVPPVEAPQTLSERGYTSSFIAERIMSTMKEIGQDAESIPHDTVTDNDAQPDIQIPGQEMSYASTVRFIKSVMHRTDVIVHVGITKTNDGLDSYVAHVQIEGGPFDSHQSTVSFEGRDLEDFVHAIAVKAMRLAEPNILASHLFTQVRKSRCSFEQCDYREIFGIYEDVLKLPASEQGEWAIAGKAWLFINQKLWKDAERQIRDALDVYTDSAVLRASLGIVLEQQNHIDAALAVLREGAREKSHTAENLRLLGDVLLHAHRYGEAIEAFRRAAEKSESVDTLHDWGEALASIGHYDEAIKHLSAAVKLRPDHAPSYVEWGRALEHKGDLHAASLKYAQALQLDPSTLSARENELAHFANAVQDAGDTPTPRPGDQARPVPNPSAASPLRASLDATHDAGGSAMHAL